MFRLGVTHARICMILTALQGESVEYFDKPLVCADHDLDLVLEIVKVLNKHSGFAYRYLVDDKPKVSSMQNMTPQYRLYNSLPDEFTTTKAVEVGDKLKIGRSTIHRYVHQFAEGKDDTGRITERIGHGVYRKILDK